MLKRRRQKEFPVDNNPKLIGLLILVIPILALANILLSAKVSHIGFQIEALNDKKLALSIHNQTLEEEIFKLSALTQIHHHAKALGFDTDNNYQDIPLPPPVAYNLD
jgi:cell division protein FtsL